VFRRKVQKLVSLDFLLGLDIFVTVRFGTILPRTFIDEKLNALFLLCLDAMVVRRKRQRISEISINICQLMSGM